MITVETEWTCHHDDDDDGDGQYLCLSLILQRQLKSTLQDVVPFLHVSRSAVDGILRLTSPDQDKKYASPLLNPSVITNPSFPAAAFKPKKVAEGTKQYQLRRYAEQTLGSGNLRSAVALPEGEDANEWIAVHGEW
jgi:phage tail sheath protein FI